MIDLVQLQGDVAGVLRALERLGNIHVVQYRKLRLESELDWSAIWMSPVNGRSGCGILVEMPVLKSPLPNVQGPAYQVDVSCVVIEEPNMNCAPLAGTLMSAEEVAQWVVDALHHMPTAGGGMLYAEGDTVRDAPEFEGVVAYRAVLHLKQATRQSERCGRVVMAMGEDQALALSCATEGASIYYTLDGSYPGSGSAGAVVYAEPVELKVGQVLRAAAHRAGMVPSGVGEYEGVG